MDAARLPIESASSILASESLAEHVGQEGDSMNLMVGLERIEERLVENDARAETLGLVDAIRRTASRPGGDQAQVRSLVELVRRLMRTPVANANVGVYDDLAVLEEQLVEASARASAEREAVESKPLPKSKKYYRDLRDKEDKNKR
ncbi:MAG TPA: hypothetical protein VNE17_14950 [Nitrolancea sp.]|nr:hypothetical protein [Nitrolancea sp.]